MVHITFTFFLVIIVSYIPLRMANAQFEYLGLSGMRVKKLQLYRNNIYAATNNGIYFKELGTIDTSWTSIGPQGLNTNTVLLIDKDTVFVGVETLSSQDTISIYRTTDGGISWLPFQNGFGGDADFREVTNLEYSVKHPEKIFATGLAVIAKSTDRGLNWELSWGHWDGFGLMTQFIIIDPLNPSIVWAGGETGSLSPILIKSINLGETWKEIFPDLGGENACYSIAIDPTNSDVVYVGTEGRVIKSVDGGQNWEMVLAPDDYPYFFGLAISPSDPSIVYAAGSINTDEPQDLVLYISKNGGDEWEIVTNKNLDYGGVGHLLLVRKNNFDDIYIVTRRRGLLSTEGVYKFRYGITGVVEDERIVPQSYSLNQNYPNPFNPETNIEYALPEAANVKLKVYNTLGQVVDILVDSELEAGYHTIHWNGENNASGIYFYRMRAGEFVETKRMLLLK